MRPSRSSVAIIVLATGVSWSTAFGQEVSPYAGDENRSIKALSEQEIADLRAGGGMGFARAAELNHYPGPRHLLDLADELELDAATVVRVRETFDAMQADAMRLGAQIVDTEAALDQAFAARSIDVSLLTELTARSAALEGELRAVHLRAHLAVTALLTAEQIHAYDVLRGYADGEGGEHDPSHHGSG